jgi:DNA-binding MarR family transcriptional regulator
MNTKININLKIIKEQKIRTREALVLGLIANNLHHEGICTTSNNKFSMLLGICIRTMNTYIINLEQKNLINRKFQYKNSKGKTRKITLTDKAKKYFDGQTRDNNTDASELET